MLDCVGTWIRRNCKRPPAQFDLLRAAQRSEDKGCDWHAVIGGNLTHSGHAYLAHCREGEFFVFALTEQQARTMGALGATTSFAMDKPRRQTGRSPAFELTRVSIDRADALDPRQQIAGVCSYETVSYLNEGFCLRMEAAVTLPGARTRSFSLFHYPDVMATDQLWRFVFPPLLGPKEAGGQVLPQSTTAFLSVCTPPQPKTQRDAERVSNLWGVLLTFR